MKKILLAAATIAAMTACNKTLIVNPVADSEYGYINLGITADDVMEVVTKSSTEAGETYRVKLEGKTDSSTDFTSSWSNLTSAEGVLNDGWVTYKYLKDNTSTLLTVPAGTYKITAENIDGSNIYTNELPNGQMHVKNTPKVFTVTSGKSVDQTISCEIQNSKVIVKKGTDFDNYFSDATISISAKTSSDETSATTFTMVWTDDAVTSSSSTYSEVYLPAGTSVVWTLSAVRKDTEASSTKYTYTNSGKTDAAITTEKGKCTAITLTPKTDGNGVIGITITTNESYTDSSSPVVIDPLEGAESQS